MSVPLYCLTFCEQSCIESLYSYGFTFSFILTIAAVLVSFYHATMHFMNFNNPFLQSKIITILLMPPIYCITSTWSLLSLQYSPYITLIRDFYEVVGLFAFFYLIFSYLAYDHDTNRVEDRKIYEIMVTEKEVSHEFPCSYFQKPYQLSNWIKAKHFSHRCKRAVLQYILVKIVTTIFLAVIYPNYELRVRAPEDWDYQLYTWINTSIYWVATLSSYVAFYYLGLFYNSLQNSLKPFHPQLKFVTINTTLFFTYWQKIIMVIFESDIIACMDTAAPNFNRRKIMYCVENFLICFEMLCMSFAGAEAFSYVDYVVPHRKSMGSFCYILKDMLSIFQSELRLVKPSGFGFLASSDQSETELQCLRENKSIQGLRRRTVKTKLPLQIMDDFY